MSLQDDTPPSENSQELNSSSHDAPEGKDSESEELPSAGCYWNGKWKSVLDRFRLERVVLDSVEECLSLIPGLLDTNITADVEDVIDIINRFFVFDLSECLFIRFLTETQTQNRLEEELLSIEENVMNASKSYHMRCMLLNFMKDCRQYLGSCARAEVNEAAVKKLFQSFASLVNLHFENGNVRTQNKRAFETKSKKGKDVLKEVTAVPALRAVLVSQRLWVAEPSTILCVVEVKKAPIAPTQDLTYGSQNLRKVEFRNSTALKFSEQLLGEIICEMLVDFGSSAFKGDKKVIAFGVQGTFVQIFVMEFQPYHFQLKYDLTSQYGRSVPRCSFLYMSPPYNIFDKDDRVPLLRVLAKLGCYQNGEL